MSRSKRFMLMSGAAIVVLGLTVGPVAASDDEDPMESMEPTASMEPAASMVPLDELEPGLHVHDAWARESPMMALAGAAYMVIHNTTDADDALVGASSPAAETVELHLSSMDDEGMMSMQPVMEIPIPAQEAAVLKPGSYHIMLIDLVEPLSEGAEVEISLEFMIGEPQTITAPVQAAGPMMGDMDEMEHTMGDMDHHDMDDDHDAEDDEDMDDDDAEDDS